jgi:hypothetical protein
MEDETGNIISIVVQRCLSMFAHFNRYGMSKSFRYIAVAVMSAMALQVLAGPPPHRVGGGYRGVGYYGHPVAHYGWRGGYWGPRVGIYVGPGVGYWGPWGYGWGFGYGMPFGYPYPAGYPLGSVPLVIDATPIPQTYIQKDPGAEAAIEPPQPTTNWYYCTQPAGYFPYVRNCSQPWITVTPPSPATPK